MATRNRVAVAIGKLFSVAKIPVGYVTASVSCRAQETAKLAFKKLDAVSRALVYQGMIHVDGKRYKDELIRFFQKLPVKAGTNTVVAGHASSLDYAPELFGDTAEKLKTPALNQSGFYVLEPKGDKFAVIGQFSDIKFFAEAMTFEGIAQ